MGYLEGGEEKVIYSCEIQLDQQEYITLGEIDNTKNEKQDPKSLPYLK